MAQLTFSVAMCTYNGADYLPAQLESIARQTLQPNELIVCDDGSTDSTPKLLREFAASAPIPVKLEFNDRNLGVKKNFEKAIKRCSGEIIALSDQDDVWHAEKLERFEHLFRREPEVGLVFTDAEIVDADLNRTGKTIWEAVGFDEQARKSIAMGRFDVLVPGWAVTGATMAFRSLYRDLSLPIPVNLSMLHDGWIALTIASVAKVVPISESLIHYRRHSKQQVGVPENRIHIQESFLDSLNTALHRETSFTELPKILSALQQRLETKGDLFGAEKALSKIGSYLQHLETRASMRSGRLTRIPAILRELTSLRYHHYSNGFKSAAKDLIR